MNAAADLHELQGRFEVFILPVVRARLMRRWPREDAIEREDALQESLALAWRAMLADWRRGVDSVPFVHRIARNVVSSVIRGESVTTGRRRYCPMRGRDQAGNSDRPTRVPLADYGQGGAALRQHVSSTFALAAHRVDFAAFLALLPEAHKAQVELLGMGYSAAEVGAMVGLCKRSVNDWRSVWRGLWSDLHRGEARPLSYSAFNSHPRAK